MKTRLSVNKNFKNEDFFKLIENALSSNRELHDLKDIFKTSKNKYELVLNNGYYELNVTGQSGYVFFSLSKRFEGRDYIVHLVFENLKDKRNIYMELECVGGAIELDRMPPFMLDIMRVVSKCNAINYSIIGKSGEVIVADEENKAELISCINNYSYDIPMVLATEYNNLRAYEIDENKLARRLAGFAYIVLADKIFIDAIKKEISTKLYNGTVVVYHRGDKKLLRKDNELYGASFDDFVFQHIKEYSQCIILPEKICEAISDNKEIKEQKKQLIAEKEKNARLNEELNKAKAENATLQKALEQVKNGEYAIIKPNEIYDGEALDLIICLLEEKKKSCNEGQKRKKQLIEELITLNPRTNNGEKMFDYVKNILYNGVDLKETGFAKLEKLGFKRERDNVHNILSFKNMYKFVTAKSTSDDRSGKNLYSNIKTTLCVYE